MPICLKVFLLFNAMIGCLNLSNNAELVQLVGCFDVQTIQDGYLNKYQRVLYYNEISRVMNFTNFIIIKKSLVFIKVPILNCLNIKTSE